MSEGVEWALHVCTVLAYLPPGESLPTARLAEFHGVPGPYLAKQLQALARAGVVDSEPGRRGGYRLARRPDDISVLDVVQAIEGEGPAFECTEIRQRGPAAVAPDCYRRPCGIARALWAAEAAWRAELQQHTVGDLVAGLAVDVPSEAAAKGAAWFKEVMR